MQLRLNPKRRESFFQNKIVIKTILFILVFSLAIFVIDKIEKPAPYKLIKQKLSNDKLITVK
tara:strand:+ start:277 stop:462 length:186 start_codon:yes stop_codon:yes gene_type:complete